VKSIRRHRFAIEERLAVVAYQRVAGQLFFEESVGKPFLLPSQALKRRNVRLKRGESPGVFAVASSGFGAGFQLSWDVQANHA
jgi:hypothetical protein